MFEGLAGLDVVRDSGVSGRSIKDWVITLRSQRGHSLKVTVHRDSYDNQSYVRFSLWSDEKGWLVLCSRSGEELLSPYADTDAWVRDTAGVIDDVTLEGCTLLGLLEA